ncbi:MAG: hypothetical protein AB1Y25_11680 [Cycloclasticus sp.]
MKQHILGFIIIIFSSYCYASGSYDYPFDNALIATVVGTPSEDFAKLPQNIQREEREVIVFPDREVNTFFPNKELHYSLVTQPHKAPLIFSIAGTGASHRSPKMRVIEKAFYQAGFHVISLPSPTYANFITTASSSQVPGHIIDDSEDLYRVMGLINAELESHIAISEFHLIGYSLGGAQAAFIAQIDDDKKQFNFKKTLMINPPVSLFNSVSQLDQLLEKNIPGGVENFVPYFNELMDEFTEMYTETDEVDFNDDFLYSIYQKRKQNIDLTRVASLIGLSFRLSSANMIFTSDIVTGGGYILPKHHQLEKTESTTKYFKKSMKMSFTDYFNDRFHPFFQAIEPSLTKDALKYRSSLNSIADYLRTAKHIAVVHNEDDIILAPGEINFFRETFKARAHIYPTGGHCGNFAYHDNVAYMVNYFQN